MGCPLGHVAVDVSRSKPFGIGAIDMFGGRRPWVAMFGGRSGFVGAIDMFGGGALQPRSLTWRLSSFASASVGVW